MRSTSHLFHLVNPSPWPFLVGFSAFFMVSGFSFYLHQVSFGGWFFLFGFLCVSYCAFFWFFDIVDEATFMGYHTLAVRQGLKLGFILFIVSEIMLFFGFFWAFFHSTLAPDLELGFTTPPVGVVPIYAFDVPLFNTFILVYSGMSVTWAHRAIALGSFKHVIDALCITILLGLLFLSLQVLEYYESSFNFSDSVYSCSFYMLTGLHGCHVFVGVSFLFVCLLRLLSRHYCTTHYLGFVFAIWYWHFVDVVWMFLFLTIYCWGSW